MEMLDLKFRRPYWTETRRLVIFILVPVAVFVLVVVIFMRQFDTVSFIGFPLGYFLLVHGFIIIGFAAVVWQAASQDRIDHRHGTHEDV